MNKGKYADHLKDKLSALQDKYWQDQWLISELHKKLDS